MFTNVSSPLHWNFSGDTIPNSLKDAPYFLLNNPIALQRKYLKLKDDPNMKNTRADLRKAVKAGEENAIGMLVELFDWLDGLEPQPTMGMVPLHGATQRIEGTIESASGSMGEVAAKKEKKLVSRHLACISAFTHLLCMMRTLSTTSKREPALEPRSRSLYLTAIISVLCPTAVLPALYDCLPSMCW